jgi:hypothetical protein
MAGTGIALPTLSRLPERLHLAMWTKGGVSQKLAYLLKLATNIHSLSKNFLFI